jgi:acetoin utilization protein AcuC
MTDGSDPAPRGWETGDDPADAVDREIVATRRAVFPGNGLDPEV